LALHYIKHKGGPEINGLQRNNERVPGKTTATNISTIAEQKTI
jgi:hypothetical protein